MKIRRNPKGEKPRKLVQNRFGGKAFFLKIITLSSLDDAKIMDAWKRASC